MTFQIVRLLLGLFAALVGPCVSASAPAYQWIDLSKCRMPSSHPPPLPRESELIYNIQRRPLNLDGNGICVVMDVWLERLGSIPDSVSRDLEVRLFRFDGKKWESLATPYPRYFPYAVRNGAGQVFYIQAPVGPDVGDDLVLDGDPIVWRAAAANKQGMFDTDGASLPIAAGEVAPVIRGLVELLNERLQSGRLLAEESSIVDFKYRKEVEEMRMKSLQKFADALLEK